MNIIRRIKTWPYSQIPFNTFVLKNSYFLSSLSRLFFYNTPSKSSYDKTMCSINITNNGSQATVPSGIWQLSIEDRNCLQSYNCLALMADDCHFVAVVGFVFDIIIHHITKHRAGLLPKEDLTKVSVCKKRYYVICFFSSLVLYVNELRWIGIKKLNYNLVFTSQRNTPLNIVSSTCMRAKTKHAKVTKHSHI